MALRKKPLAALEKFIPTGTFDYIATYLERYKIKLSITKERKTKYGDYRPPQHGQTHRISVNGNLNQYHFLLTLVHELAHLVAFDQYGFAIQSHGDEWKKTFKTLLSPLLTTKVFPPDLLAAVQVSMQNVKSSSCYDPTLSLALRKYDIKPMGTLIKDLPLGSHFLSGDKKEYKLLNKRRTRYEAVQTITNKHYLFPALYEVEKL
jgi:hypothetical protein